MEQNVTAEEENHCAAVQTRAMNVTTLPGLDIGPEQLIEQQKANQTLKKKIFLRDDPLPLKFWLKVTYPLLKAASFDT